MTSYWQDAHRTIYNKSCLDMSELQGESVQCCVTSPPYWGLRKYAGEQTVHFNDGDYSFGLEPSPEIYIAHSIQILREIRRVLRKDGVVFWNIGDSYASGFSTSDNKYKAMSGHEPCMKFNSGVKPKDLCLIPFRIAIAAQTDGWYVRSVIIWSKPNPMPESVRDRPTESHEYILMLTKSSRYFWDMEAVKEDCLTEERTKLRPNGIGTDKSTGGFNCDSGCGVNASGRNLRSVWTINTQPYSGAHFATYPEELVERCVKAASFTGSTILDPFMGSGTTLKVAAKLGRKAIGYDISEEYCKLAIERNRQAVLV